MNFRVGDRVKVKSWDALVKEFGLHKDGQILTPLNFLPMMRPYCGKLGEIEEVVEDKKSGYYLNGVHWLFPEESLTKHGEKHRKN